MPDTRQFVSKQEAQAPYYVGVDLGGTNIKALVNEHSEEAALCIVGFHSEQLKHDGEQVFLGYENTGDTLFVNARELQKLS